MSADRFGAAQHLVEKPQPDASHQDGGDGHQRHCRATAGQPGPDHRPLILAEQPFDPPQRDRIDIPGVAGNMRDRLDAAVVAARESGDTCSTSAEASHNTRCGTIAHGRRRQQIRQCIGKALDLKNLAVLTAPDAPTIASHGLTRTAGSISTGRAPSFNCRVKQSCMLRNCVCFASLRSRSEKNRQVPSETSRTSGCSIWLNHPMNRVARRRGIRLVSRKLRSSCCTISLSPAGSSWDQSRYHRRQSDVRATHLAATGRRRHA